MEQIFETVYPEYKEFKENIDKIHNEFIDSCRKMWEFNEVERLPFISFTEFIRTIVKCGFNHFKVICKLDDSDGKGCRYFDNFGNIYLRRNCVHRAAVADQRTRCAHTGKQSGVVRNCRISGCHSSFGYMLVGNKNLDLRFNDSYFNFFMFQKYPCINIATFYEDNAVLIERIKELYYSLPYIKKKNEEKNNFEEIKKEEKNKFEEIQKELNELKNELKIKDEEISKIKDDLDDKNKLLKKILTKL